MARFLFRPVSPFIVNQLFGENKACIDIKTGTKTIACDGLNPPAGYKSIYSQMNGHSGTDLYAVTNQPIYSSQDGIVAELVDEPMRGLGLGIITTNKFYCKETKKNEHFKIRYWHNARHNVRLGQKVFIGDLIAWADNTGYSAGSHLHWEAKPTTVKWNKDGSIKSYKNTLQDNGYFGAVDPLQYTREENAVKLQNLKSIWERILWAVS
jgi:murein DD-endopeptidase MepM/ murein hydrolase activator NlpD